jgi:DNA-binding winged helix-turn-helix (wHTH) protein
MRRTLRAYGGLGLTEEAERVQIGTRLLPGPGAGPLGAAEPASTQLSPDDQAAGPGADGALLAIVPIPGTGTSLAIVGYAVDNSIVAGRQASADGDEPGNETPTAPGLLLDHDQRRVRVDGREITLTYQEFELLAFLAAHPETVFSRADLVARVWQRDFAADSRTVDVHVSRLRHKLGPQYGRCLVTEYRVGYQFRNVSPGGTRQPPDPRAL